MKRRVNSDKTYSTLKGISIKMISESYSFLSVKTGLNAVEVGNNILLKGALMHLNTCKTVKVTLNVSNVDSCTEKDIRFKKIAKCVSHLNFNGIDSPALAKETSKKLKTVAQWCGNLQTISFKGDCVRIFYDSMSFYHNDFINKVHQLTKTNDKLRLIEFTEKHYVPTIGNLWKSEMKKILKKLKTIEKITHSCQK